MTQSRNTPELDRPLTARSVIASTLLGMQPPRLDTRTLVRSGELFGIPEGTTRVAISRMTTAGELTADGNGYRLAGPLLARQQRQDESRQASRTMWSGRWTTAIVVAEARTAADRLALRTAMTALRRAEVREGVWLRPDNLAPGLLIQHEAVVKAQCRILSAELADRDDPALAASLWDIGGWATRARRLHQDMARPLEQLQANQTDALAPAFVLSAAILRHFQADPLLPNELLPADWPGAELRAAYNTYDHAFRAVWRRWYGAQD